MRCTLQMTTPSAEAPGMEPGRPARVFESEHVRYTEIPPPRDLAADVVCFWTMRVAPDGPDHDQSLLPDLSVDLIASARYPAFVMGPPTAALRVSVPAGTVFHGVRLRANAARRVLDCAPTELLDNIVPLDTVLRAPLRPTLGPAGSLHGVVADWLRRSANDHGSADPTVRSAINWLGTNWQSSVDDLSRQVNWSDRKLRRRFVATVGMGPKLVQRIVRVQHALHLLRAPAADVSLCDLAAECGFADQAHMTREVAYFTNHTPRGLRSLSRAWAAETF
jgi:AraC-like DNA-binding protein